MILLFDVLEHLPDPAASLRKLTAALAAGGKLAVTVPNFDRFAVEGASWPGVQAYWEHLNYFTQPFLADALAGMGLSVVARHTYTAGSDGQRGFGEASLRRFRQRLRSGLPFLEGTLRILRRLKFALAGPPHVDVRTDGSGMDQFLLAENSH